MAEQVNSTNLRLKRDERRRQYRKRLPEHFCPACSALTFIEDEQCLHCGDSCPAPGWTALTRSKDPWLGQVIDNRYLIVKRLGHGASATVYHAESLSIPRQFAIKIIDTSRGHGDLGAEQIVTRLNREVDALGRLRNPHIISFYEVLELNGYSVATVMDLVEGVTLEAMVSDGGPLSIPRACSLLRQMANGLFEAHQAGMIHRDLKPENIMVERMPAGDDFVFVLDFGIVHVDDNVHMTQGFIGTPLYASPEQAVAAKVDHRSDIYSLGAILYFMLTGRPPFVSNNVYEVLKMHVRSTPRRLCEIQPTRLFPDELEQMVARMLAKKADERPRDLSQVIAELDSFAHASYSDAQAQSAATQHSTPYSTEMGLPSGLEQKGDSSATVQGHQPQGEQRPAGVQRPSREPADTPLFMRRDTPNRISNGYEVKPLPARVEYSPPAAHRVPTPSSPQIKSRVTKTLSIPVENGSVLAACAPGPAFALLDEKHENLRLFSDIAGAERLLQPTFSAPPLSMAMSSKYLIWGHDEGTISRMDMLEGKPQVLFQDVRQVGITSVATDPKDNLIVAGSASGRVYISRNLGCGARSAYHAESGEVVIKASAEWGRMKSGRAVQCVTVSPTADTVAVARDGGEVEIFHASSPRTPMLTFLVMAPVINMAISDDNYLLAVAMTNDTVVLYQVLTGKPVMTVKAQDRRVLALNLTDNSQPIALCEEDGRAVILSLQQINVPSPAH